MNRTHPKEHEVTPSRLPISYGAVVFFAGWATGSVQTSIILSGLALTDEPIVRRPLSR